MTYYADLTRYEFLGGLLGDHVIDNALNVGWLSGQIVYTEGNTSKEFQGRLLKFCNGVVNPTRGWHSCEFCPPTAYDPVRGNPLEPFGTAEIRVFYKDNTYAAPNLIYHYVTEHNYKPPEEFIEAVLQGPLPGSSEYEELIQQLGVNYWLDEDDAAEQ